MEKYVTLTINTFWNDHLIYSYWNAQPIVNRSECLFLWSPHVHHTLHRLNDMHNYWINEFFFPFPLFCFVFCFFVFFIDILLLPFRTFPNIKFDLLSDVSVRNTCAANWELCKRSTQQQQTQSFRICVNVVCNRLFLFWVVPCNSLGAGHVNKVFMWMKMFSSLVLCVCLLNFYQKYMLTHRLVVFL